MYYVLVILLLLWFWWYREGYELPVFVSSRGFTTTYKPYDYYDSLRQDLVYSAN